MDIDIVGPWLHTHSDSGEINWQGKIVGKDGYDDFRVQLFSWLTGDRTHCITMTSKEIAEETTLYANEDEWLAASERGFNKITEAAALEFDACYQTLSRTVRKVPVF